VCKDAKLFAVKVLDCRGSGSTSSVIRGIEYAFKRHLEQTKASSKQLRSIVSMSLGGGYSRALNMAVKATVKASGFYFSAAAGNEDQDACRTSPASVKEIFTVMASDKYDNRAYFSNFGKCADIYSPGVDIYSTIPGDRVAKYSGTSMATPILVGVLNHYIDQNPTLDMKDLKNKVLSDATKDILSGNPKGTKNSFVFLNRM
jgi:cerevisin